jgi:hypothetical protein
MQVFSVYVPDNNMTRIIRFKTVKRHVHIKLPQTRQKQAVVL